VRVCLGFLVVLCGMVSAEEPVRRHVLALIEGTRPDPHNEDVVHEILELPLNHLGMLVRRHYIGNGPPPEAWLEDARAVLTYFGADAKPCAWLWPWLRRVVPHYRLRVIHFGDFGPLETKELPDWLARFGLKYDDGFLDGPVALKVDFIREKDCAYEADPRLNANHRGPRSISRRNTPWVTTRPLYEQTDVRHPVVTGPWGAIALDPWAVKTGSDDQDRRWHLNPFLFFRDALGLNAVPAPHPSVLNGRRMWFLQVDGDGFESLTTIRPNELAAAVMLDEVFLKYKLPYTVSIIVRSLTTDYDVEQPTDAMRLAKRILNLENVEAASHGVLHTLLWQQSLTKDSPPRTIMWYGSLQHYTYSDVAEVRDSIRFIDSRLMIPPKRCEVMLWTGHANPFERAIQAAVDAKCWNVNGGVFRWDRWSDSVGFVSPWSRRVGKRLQVYAGAANENDFEGFFDTMPGAFGHIDTTVERTGHPRILKPANLYIHFYSAEHEARLQSIHDLVRRWAFREPTAPVFASTYAKAVHSAVNSARIAKTKQGWRFHDFGGCRTVRIDDETRRPDFAKSYGLLGARRLNGSLYLHLARNDAEVVLAKDPPRYPHVEEANCLLRNAVLDGRSVAVTATAHNRREVRFAGFEPGARVAVVLDGEPEKRTADKQGRIRVRLPDPGTTRILVR